MISAMPKNSMRTPSSTPRTRIVASGQASARRPTTTLSDATEQQPAPALDPQRQRPHDAGHAGDDQVDTHDHGEHPQRDVGPHGGQHTPDHQHGTGHHAERAAVAPGRHDLAQAGDDQTQRHQQGQRGDRGDEVEDQHHAERGGDHAERQERPPLRRGPPQALALLGPHELAHGVTQRDSSMVGGGCPVIALTVGLRSTLRCGSSEMNGRPRTSCGDRGAVLRLRATPGLTSRRRRRRRLPTATAGRVGGRTWPA